jgi:hypothetical protein
MYEDRRPFGIIKDTMIAEVDSYLNELTDRASAYISDELTSLVASSESSAEQMFRNSMGSRNVAAAIVWKAVTTELLRSDSETVPDEDLLYKRVVILTHFIKDEVTDIIDNTDFSFLETLSDDELKNELNKSFQEMEVPAIVFFISVYSLKNQLSKISGHD